jgi:UDP-2,4-diacetamido-2,4,6-trideoxy-beta-L-altropyranose hydrolase
MLSVAFRVDSSAFIGSGHLIRCLSIASSLLERGARIHIISSDNHDNLLSSLGADYQNILIPSSLRRADTRKEFEDFSYSDWIDCSQIEDASKVISAYKNNNISAPDWIVVDHYALSSEWSDYIKKNNDFKSVKLCFLDDLCNRKHNADIIVDANYHGKETHSRYDGLVAGKTVRLLGPSYALMNKHFAASSRESKRREGFNSVLVYFGSADLYNMTKEIVSVFLSKEFNDLSIHVVLGLHNACESIIREKLRGHKNYICHSYVNNMAALMSECDLAIGAGGSTTWERIVMHLPSIVYSLAHNQESFLSTLEQDGYITYLGHASNYNQRQFLATLRKIRSSYSNYCFDNLIVDPYGCSRIATAIFDSKEEYDLRDVQYSDILFLYRLVNDPLVRANSINNKEIRFEDHRDWLLRGLQKSNRQHYVMCSKIDAAPYAQIRFDETCSYSGIIEIDLSIHSSIRGRGHAIYLLTEGIARAKNYFLSMKQFKAVVFKDNEPSNKVFASLGFALQDSLGSSCNEWVLPSYVCAKYPEGSTCED